MVEVKNFIRRTILSLAVLLCLADAKAQTPYFQQKVDYSIDVRLDDSNHMLFANESLIYYNQSPDTLHFLYFHLWPNAYKNNHTAMARQMIRNNSTKFHYASEDKRGWIDSLDFQDDIGKLEWHLFEKNIDICQINLRKPLAPGESVHISTPFVVKIPGDFSRLGHVGKSYQISQWYPKPAVYDRDGWHPMPYLDQGEFYSEYGSFDVKITLPATYRVAATGVLQEQSEMDWLEKLAVSPNYWKKDTVMEEDMNRVGKMKTISYKQDKVHDFAFFCDQKYLVRKDTAVLEDGTQVAAWAFFEKFNHTPWYNGAYYVKRAIESYSKWVGKYPYSAATAVQGALSAGGGMEYPMVTVISAGSDSVMLDDVITHEVGHNWFYGILGSNERLHAWMDEGFNSFEEERYMNEYYPNRSFGSEFGLNNKELNKLDRHWLSYLTANFLASYGLQDAINTPSVEFQSLQYGIMSYKRMAFLLEYLRSYLGTSAFDACMHAYFDEWKFKHPQPSDIEDVFERVSGKKLDWFFKDLIDSERQGDYAIKGIEKTNNGYKIRVVNKGQVDMPYSITLMKDSSEMKTIWFDGHHGSTWVELPYPTMTDAYLDKDYVTTDLNLANNHIKSHGIFKKGEPLKVKLLTSFQKNDRRAISVFPSIGVNTADGMMAGLMIHNYTVQGKKFNFFFAPMYGFNSKTMAGNFFLKYDIFVHDRSLNKIRFNLQYKRFADYDKVEPSISFFESEKRMNLFTKRRILVRSEYTLSHALIDHRNGLGGFTGSYQVSRFQMTSESRNALNFAKFHLSIAYINGPNGRNQLRLEETGNRVDRIGRKTKLVSRVYLGAVLGNGNNYFSLFSASSPDVFKDYYLIDRVGNGQAGWFGRNQALTDQGNLTSFNRSAYSLLSASVRWDIRWYFQPYLKGALLDGIGYYESGIGVNLKILRIYLPIVSNGYTNYVPENGNQWLNSIRFSFNIPMTRFWNRTDMNMAY